MTEATVGSTDGGNDSEGTTEKNGAETVPIGIDHHKMVIGGIQE